VLKAFPGSSKVFNTEGKEITEKTRKETDSAAYTLIHRDRGRGVADIRSSNIWFGGLGRAKGPG
jgi:hypothetical protein